MRNWKTKVLRSMTLVVLSIFIFGGTGLSKNQPFLEELPAEYGNVQGIIVAWLPYGPIPTGPITELSNDEVLILNKQSMSEMQGRGHKWKPKYSEIMAEKLKLKKGAGSPDTDGLDIDVYPYHYMMLDLVKAIIDSGATAHIVTDNPDVSHELTDFMFACGFKEHEFEKIVFHYYWLDSIWTRDYGPWVTKVHNRLAVIDSKYYPERPNDDGFPAFFSSVYNLPITSFDEIGTEGGNILTDQHRRGFSTQAILFFNPGWDYDNTVALFEDVLNLNEFIFLPGDITDPSVIYEALAALGGTGHVDMGLKLLSDTKVMIGDFASGTSGKDLLDSWAEWFNTHTNLKGEPYEVYRVTGSTDGECPYSYINSLIVNKTIIVPQFGHAEGDAAAIAAYQKALPGYKTIGVRSELLTPWSGGLHCITKEIPLGILKADDTIGPGAD